jgi:hypothetical protein
MFVARALAREMKKDVFDKDFIIIETGYNM